MLADRRRILVKTCGLEKAKNKGSSTGVGEKRMGRASPSRGAKKKACIEGKRRRSPFT